ncbi:helix-turn-helix domain-containing protein [Nocardia sp. NPDC005746]|uniref:MarR family transcriptional regulator n=1 Tax=unclassified Nocardia TaxID=2637762 RepID=UPI00340C3053
MATGSIAEAAVLGVLAPGGMLTAAQISEQAQITGASTRRAIGQLESRGLVMAASHASRWSITPRGRAAWVTKFRRYAQ